MDTSEAFDLISKIDALYQSAWSTLIWSVTGLLALFGILVPLIENWYRRRTLAQDRTALEMFVEKEIDTVREELSKHVDSQIEIERNDIRAELVNAQSRMTGGVMMVQAELLRERESYNLAIFGLIGAVANLSDGLDYRNLRAASGNLISILPYVDFESLCSDHPDVEEKFELMHAALNKVNGQGHYDDLVADMLRAWNEMKARVEDAGESGN